MRLISWNVNGLRACIGKGFYDFAQSVEADIISVQETKMQPGQAAVELPGYPLLGVQFHPERMSFGKRRPDTVDGAAIFAWFLELCQGWIPPASP